MNTQSNAIPDTPIAAQGFAPAVIPESRLLYWSVLRELWESRSIYIAPLAVAGLILFGFLISTFRLPDKMRAALTLDPIAAARVARTDRTTLLRSSSWGPRLSSQCSTVSTRCTANVAIAASCSGSRCRFPISRPCSRRRLFRWWFSRCSPSQSPWSRNAIMLLMSSAVLLGSGLSVATLWAQLSLPQTWLMLLYHLVTVHALWYAPIFGWLLLVSAWARRVPILWAALTGARDRAGREDRVQHFAFRSHAGEPHRRWCGSCHHAGWQPDGSDDTPHSGSFPDERGSVDRAGDDRRIPRRSGPAAPLSRTDLSRIHSRFPTPCVMGKRL